MSPASPEKAIRVCLFRLLVLSSSALMIVGPRIIALDAATRTKSLPVIPKRTSLASAVSQSEQLICEMVTGIDEHIGGMSGI